MFAAPMLPRGRGRVVSDSYLTVPPTHDDSGTKARMWLIAQDTPTFDEDDPPPKEQVASDAVVNSAIGRRSRKADFSCTLPGCKATFTAKHNLHNHLNSHYRIRNFKCAQCERDFGTAHVLQRHRRVCKGTKRIRIPTPGGN
ncbi:hypothetical protein BDP27DRAFT_655332 [Rhodocollybia butyracea]|uniref:C2H2-type domain-containing protein n=1 Tax=Rhodocollybia butyracea TaxID=206335 RepID=A0A9P5TW07_9AGAR|nr:hypothetical protein BDP27DRAFT_655332 [Rhodocollybia butyracea]